MKIKRAMFIAILLMLFGGCFYAMNQHYDELARYPYELTEEQREIVLAHLDTEQINYLVTQKIEPDQFLPFIETDGFELENTLWYTKAMQTREEEATYIVNFINKYRSFLEYGTLQDMLSNYSYNVLTRYFDEGYEYGSDVKLVADPANRYTMLSKAMTVYTYEPADLVAITSLPHDSIVDDANDIMVKKEVLKPLTELLESAKEINKKAYGDMMITIGYLSYEDQITLLASKQKEYGDAFATKWDLPGQSEYQLGYSVTLKPKEEAKASDDKAEDKKEESEEIGKEQIAWLKENAYRYGFVVRYPKQKESVTGKAYQPFTLRYVGKELAKHMYDEEKVMEEVNFESFLK